LPYRQLISWDRGYADYYTVEIRTGRRTKILENFPDRLAFLLELIIWFFMMMFPAPGLPIVWLTGKSLI